MSQNPLTRRDFMRLGAGTVAAGALAGEITLSTAALDARPGAASSPLTDAAGTDAEMAMAADWTRAFGEPSGTGTRAGRRLLPEILKPPFSFVYGGAKSQDLLPAWKCEVKRPARTA